MTLTRNDLTVIEENAQTIFKFPGVIVETPNDERYLVMEQDYGTFEDMVGFLEKGMERPLNEEELETSRKIYAEETNGVQIATEVFRITKLNGPWLESLHGNSEFDDLSDEDKDQMAEFGLALGLESVSPVVKIQHHSVEDALDALVEHLNA